MVFFILQSNSMASQLESQLSGLIRGLGTNELTHLSPCQLAEAGESKRKSIEEEKEISEKIVTR